MSSTKLKELAYLNSGLEIVIVDERTDRKQVNRTVRARRDTKTSGGDSTRVHHRSRDLLEDDPLLPGDDNLPWRRPGLRLRRGHALHASVGSRPSDDEASRRPNPPMVVVFSSAPMIAVRWRVVAGYVDLNVVVGVA